MVMYCVIEGRVGWRGTVFFSSKHAMARNASCSLRDAKKVNFGGFHGGNNWFLPVKKSFLPPQLT